MSQRKERGLNMLGRRKKGPDKAFSHSEDCKIQAADPTVSIKWSEVERGHWRAVCQCGAEDYYKPVADRVRSDPLDAKTTATRGSASSSPRPMSPCSGSS